MAAFDYWREECVNHFNGMWAFIIYDNVKDVFFISAENDQLNLKSMLSVYIFLTASRIPNLLKNGKLLFMDPEDRLVLQDYVE